MQTRQTPEEIAIWLCNNVPAMRAQWGVEDEAVIAQAIREYGDKRAAQEREHASILCAAWGSYWAELYTSKIAPHQLGTALWAVSEKVKAHEPLDVVRAAQEQLAIERMPKRRKRA